MVGSGVCHCCGDRKSGRVARATVCRSDVTVHQARVLCDLGLWIIGDNWTVKEVGVEVFAHDNRGPPRSG